MGIEDILDGLGYHGQDLEVAKLRLDAFNKTLSSLETSIDVSQMFVSIGKTISIDSTFQLFKKWSELIVIEEKNIKSFDDASTLYRSSNCLIHGLQNYYPVFTFHTTKYVSVLEEMIKTAEGIRQRVVNSHNINF